jgi:lipid II:glycine glycyltransferase (peptidoglycan interpeptide bridge formation enzyme)
VTVDSPLRVIVSDAGRDGAWDAFVASAPGGDHVQSSGWARTKASQGYAAIRVVLERDDRIVAGAQILVRGLPVLGGIGYVPRGPVVAAGNEGDAGRVIEHLKLVARRRRIRHLVVQPGRECDWIAEMLPDRGFVPSAMAVAPTATVLVDLTRDLDELFRGFGKSARRHVRRGLREGVVVREGTVDDLGAFHALVVATAERNGFTPYAREYFETMWRAFHTDGHLRLFLAEYQHEVVSAHLVVPFGEHLLSKVVAWSGSHARVYPNEVLEWHLMEWAKAHGFRAYDFEGVDRTTAEHLLADTSARVPVANTADAFKLKFGGRAILLPTAYDYFPSGLLARTYGRAYRTAFSGGWPKASIARVRTRSGKASPA